MPASDLKDDMVLHVACAMVINVLIVEQPTYNHLASTNEAGSLLDVHLSIHWIFILQIQHGNFDALGQLVGGVYMAHSYTPSVKRQ
jgi:hypothetical protein